MMMVAGKRSRPTIPAQRLLAWRILQADSMSKFWTILQRTLLAKSASVLWFEAIIFVDCSEGASNASVQANQESNDEEGCLND